MVIIQWWPPNHQGEVSNNFLIISDILKIGLLSYGKKAMHHLLSWQDLEQFIITNPHGVTSKAKLRQKFLLLKLLKKVGCCMWMAIETFKLNFNSKKKKKMWTYSYNYDYAGVPKESILIEDKSQNTGQNYEFVQKLLEEKGIAKGKPILI